MAGTFLILDTYILKEIVSHLSWAFLFALPIWFLAVSLFLFHLFLGIYHTCGLLLDRISFAPTDNLRYCQQQYYYSQYLPRSYISLFHFQLLQVNYMQQSKQHITLQNSYSKYSSSNKYYYICQFNHLEPYWNWSDITSCLVYCFFFTVHFLLYGALFHGNSWYWNMVLCRMQFHPKPIFLKNHFSTYTIESLVCPLRNVPPIFS